MADQHVCWTAILFDWAAVQDRVDEEWLPSQFLGQPTGWPNELLGWPWIHVNQASVSLSNPKELPAEGQSSTAFGQPTFWGSFSGWDNKDCWPSDYHLAGREKQSANNPLGFVSACMPRGMLAEQLSQLIAWLAESNCGLISLATQDELLSLYASHVGWPCGFLSQLLRWPKETLGHKPCPLTCLTICQIFYFLKI